LESLPAGCRPNTDDPDGPQILIRSDSAGATYRFASTCRTSGVGFSGATIDAPIRNAVEVLNTAEGWYPAIDSGGGIREGAWVAEATALVDLSAWPAGTRLILCKERPHPGAQLRFTDSDGHRVTGFLTDPADGVVPVSWQAWNCAIANTPGWKTASAKLKPPACATYRSMLLTPMRHGSKSSWLQPI
jgi:hypothetical protein